MLTHMATRDTIVNVAINDWCGPLLAPGRSLAESMPRK
jgi:hypothetical protein